MGESVQQPLRYYDNNVVGTVRLLEAMEASGVQKHCVQLVGHGVRVTHRSCR